jgi:CubicO group peptidase (beta-lactamase class C family)
MAHDRIAFIFYVFAESKGMGKAIFLFLLFLIAEVNASHILARAPGDKIDFNAIDRYIAAKMQLPRIPGLALAIVKDDQIIYLKGYGQADPRGHAVTPQTSFIIGSVTKAFTALAVMQLVEGGKVELDAPVQRYISWFRVADPVVSAKITVRQLLNQTSGLPMLREPQFWTELDDGALERTVRFLKTAKVNFQPGQSFGYSNANYETLGLIVQKVAGQLYEEYVEQHIFRPLDMRNSFVSQEKASQHEKASGYRWWFGIPFPVTFHYNRSELPAGYIFSSAEDMAHFLIAQMNGGQYGDSSILSPDGIALTHTEPVPNTYAMGWESGHIDGYNLVSHDGGTPNFQCSVFFDPDERIGVFIAANVMCALDAFSSPHGSTALDGSTVRGMAHNVLSMVANRPLPEQGRGIRKSYIIFDVAILALSVLLIIFLMRISKRYQKLKRIGIATRSHFLRRIGLVSVLHFAWPLLVLYLALKALLWKVLTMFQPDLVYWLEIVAMVVFLKGLLEIMLTRHIFRQSPPKRYLL